MVVQKPFCENGEFCCDAQGSIQGPGIFSQRRNILDRFPGFRDSQGEGASPKTESVMQDQNITIAPAFLFDHIQTRDPEIHTALSHADHNVAGTLENDVESRERRHFRLILPRVRFEDS